MALLGEEVVEEWLNRQGYFTIRGIKLGVHEMDILAFRPRDSGVHECRHIEVQISTNPIAYISKVPKKLQKERGIGADNAKTRPLKELVQGVREWVEKKFNHPKKVQLREKLWAGKWTRELVVNVVRHPEELDVFKRQGIQILHFENIVREMTTMNSIISSAAGCDLLTLMHVCAGSRISREAAEILDAAKEEAEVESED